MAHLQCLSGHLYPLRSYTFGSVRCVQHSPLPRQDDGDRLEVGALACPPTMSLIRSPGGCCGGLGWVLMGTRAAGTEGLLRVRWAMFPEEGEKQKASLEEGSSVSHGLRERKKEGWGEKRRRREEEEKVLEAQVSWHYFPAVFAPEGSLPGKSHCLENRGVNEEKPYPCSHLGPPATWHLVVSVSWKIQMAMCKPKCVPR